jgi:CBS domain-containing protein
LVGIFTEHDVLLRMAGQESSSAKLQFVEPLITDSSGKTANRTATLIEEMQLNVTPFSEIPVEEMRADAVAVTETETEGTSVNDSRFNRRPINEAPVKTLMTANPEVLKETDSVAEALNKMSLGRYRHIPFQKADGTYAVASIKSVLKYIAQEDW